MNTRKAILIPLALIVLVIGSVFASAQLFGSPRTISAADPKELPRTVSVSGNYVLSTAPDKADFTVSIETEAVTAKNAIALNREQTNKVIAALKTAGVDAKEIQTLNFYVYKKEEPVYPDPATNIKGAGGIDYYPGPYKTKVVGYVATNTIRVTTKNLDKVGQFIDAASEAGATSFGGVSFSLSTEKQNDLSKRLLEGAAKNARDKAETLAGALGTRVGRIMTISESGGYYPPAPYYNKNVMADAFGALAESTPIEPGQVDTSMSVSVVFELE